MEINQKELADHLPLILDFVFQGGTVVVTHGGVSKIEIKKLRTDEEQIEFLISSGKVRPPLRPGPITFGPPYKLQPGEKSPFQHLLEERYGEDCE